MHVEMGNLDPKRTENSPAVTTIVVPDSYTYEVAKSAKDLSTEMQQHIATAPDGITNKPDQEALLTVVAVWNAESRGRPTWVWSDNEPFAVLLGHYYGCPVGRPDDVEDLYYTKAGAPGVGPDDFEYVPAVDPFPAPEETS